MALGASLLVQPIGGIVSAAEPASNDATKSAWTEGAATAGTGAAPTQFPKIKQHPLGVQGNTATGGHMAAGTQDAMKRVLFGAAGQTGQGQQSTWPKSGVAPLTNAIDKP